MIDKDATLDAAMEAISQDKYGRASEILGVFPSDESDFDVQYLRSSIHFGQFMNSREWTDLHRTLKCAHAALDLDEEHSDLHLLLGQGYATVFVLSAVEAHRGRARRHYQRALELLDARPGLDPEELAALKTRCAELIVELEESTPEPDPAFARYTEQHGGRLGGSRDSKGKDHARAAEGKT